MSVRASLLCVAIASAACRAAAPSNAAASNAAATARAPSTVERELYAALPLRNLTPDSATCDEVSERLRDALAARGATFVAEDALERVLREKRIRYTDSLSRDAARAIGSSTGARHVLLGTLIGAERAPVPRLSIAWRVIDVQTGERECSSLISLDGNDFRGALGLGAIREPSDLVAEVVARALDSFDARGAPRHSEPRIGSLGSDRPADALSNFVDASFALGHVGRLTVLPLTNRTRRPDVGLLFAEILAHHCFRDAGIQVIEAAELRAALTREKIRSIESLDLAVLARIGQDVGARYVVTGSVDRFEDDVWVDDQHFPEVEASLRVIDVETKRLVAATTLRRRGDHYRKWLGLGAVHDTIELSSRAAHELMASIAG